MDNLQSNLTTRSAAIVRPRTRTEQVHMYGLGGIPNSCSVQFTSMAWGLSPNSMAWGLIWLGVYPKPK